MTTVKPWTIAIVLGLSCSVILKWPAAEAQDRWNTRPQEGFDFRPPSADHPTALLALRQVANTITVKILAGESWGSGTIVKRDRGRYEVITNAHVLTAGQGRPIRIKTMDGRTHPARVMPRSSAKPTDLALLEFRSPHSYQAATLVANPGLPIGAPVFSAGYPFHAGQSDSMEFVVNAGKIALVPDQIFTGGYQVGYTNVVEKGMSGGPVLAGNGHVVAINGMHAFPIWGDPYVYEDGSKPNLHQKAKMRQLSWGIPSGRILSFLGLPQTNAFSVKQQMEPPIL